MLVSFESSATGEITMYQSHIAGVLERLGKSAEKGVFTVAELQHVIEVFEQIMAEDRQQRAKEIEIDEDDLDEFEKKKKKDFVTLSARLFPLYEMLKIAQKKQKEVIWGI